MINGWFQKLFREKVEHSNFAIFSMFFLFLILYLQRKLETPGKSAPTQTPVHSNLMCTACFLMKIKNIKSEFQV